MRISRQLLDFTGKGALDNDNEDTRHMLGETDAAEGGAEGGPEEGAAGEVGSNEPIATRFLKLCDEEDSRKRLSRWINVDALLPFARESDPCRAVSERCVPPLPDEFASR